MTAKRYIAILADTQLNKELYGLDATRQDWFDALMAAVRSIKARSSEVGALLILGDVMDKEEVSSRATFFLLQAIKELAPLNIPIGILLGNHDNPTEIYGQADSTGSAKVTINWVRVCQQVNPNVVELSLKTPLQLEGTPEYGPLHILGSHHQARADITAALLATVPPVKAPNGETWLCLHQSLRELSAHVSAWEIAVTDVPAWADRVFLGDFHDFLTYRDGLGRLFTYPGATETVSFNQAKTPGFIFYDRVAKTMEHVSTQQREYLTFRLNDMPVGEWEATVTARLRDSLARFRKLPVARVFYTTADWEQWAKLEPKLGGLCLRLTAQPAESKAEAPENTSDLEVPQSREDVKRMAQELLTEAASDQLAQDCLLVLNDTANLRNIRAQRFAQAVNRPSAATTLTPTAQLPLL